MNIKESLNRVKSISKGVYYLFNILFYIYCLATIFIVGLSAVALLFPSMSGIRLTVRWEGVVGIILLMIPVAAILRVISLIFRDITKEETPFTMKQVKRLRWIALFILLDVVINAVFSAGLFGVIGSPFGTVGVVGGGYTNHVSIDIFEAFFAVVIFCLSFAFEYGYLLQEDCNDTL